MASAPAPLAQIPAAPAAPAEPAPRPIIVKKVTVVAGGGHHGGAWKVAYADFVTAMMAFFLMLWLLGATNEQQRKGIADYFAPTLVKYRDKGLGGTGLLKGDALVAADEYPHAAGQTGTRSMTVPRGATGGPKEGGGRGGELERRIAERLASSEALRRLGEQVRLVDTTEGIRIDLVDDADFSMFALGTTVLTPDARLLVGAIGAALGTQASDLAVRGHTDALVFRGNGGVNNWSLSTGRAEATRQALLREGVAAARFRRIEGVADREPLITDDPADPRNRRISITVLD